MSYPQPSTGNPYHYTIWYEVHRSNSTAGGAFALLNGFNAGWVPCLGASAILHTMAAAGVTAGTLDSVTFSDPLALVANDKFTTDALSAISSGYTFDVAGPPASLHAHTLHSLSRSGLFATVSGSNVVTALDRDASELCKLVSMRCPSDINAAGTFGPHITGTGIQSNSVVTAKNLSAGLGALVLNLNATASAPAGVTLTSVERLGGGNWHVLRPVATVSGTTALYNYDKFQHRFYRAAINIGLTTGPLNSIRWLVGVCYDHHPTSLQQALAHSDPIPTTALTERYEG